MMFVCAISAVQAFFSNGGKTRGWKLIQWSVAHMEVRKHNIAKAIGEGLSNRGRLRTGTLRADSGQHHVTPRSHHFCMESRTHLKALLLEVLTVSGRFEAFTQKAGTGAGKSQYLSEVGGHVCQAVYATCHKADSLHQGYTLGIKGPAACCPESILASRDNADEEPGILKPNGFVTNSTIVYSTML